MAMLTMLRRVFSSFDERAAVFGSLGFIAGAFAWHFIGFWIFVSDIVLHTQRGPLTGETAAVSQGAPADAITTGSITPLEAVGGKAPTRVPSCAALVLDRALGTTRLETCVGTSDALRDGGHQRRTSLAATTPRLQNPTAWASGTELQAPAKPAYAIAPVQPQDVDMSIKHAP